MKHWVLLAMLAVAACEKTSDLPAMQQEMTGMVKSYAAKFDELEQRGSQLTQRIKSLPTESAALVDANNTLAEAGNRFRELHDVLGRVPNEIKAAVTAGKPDQLRQISDGLLGSSAEKAPPPTELEVELGRTTDALRRRLEDGFVEINSALDAVDSTLALAENRPAAPATKSEAAKQDAPKTETPATAPTEGASAAPAAPPAR